MERSLSFLDQFIDLDNENVWNDKIIQEYSEVHDKFHEYEFITAEFKYKDDITEKYRSEVNWIELKEFILNDFMKLPYPPTHLYVCFDCIIANYFTPYEYLLDELKSEDKEIMLKNLEKQFKNLTVCDLIKLVPTSGERDISKEMYFDYYRKKQFEKILLAK